MPNGLKMFDLTGRVAVVTGGATGIGLSLSKGLAAAGAAVLIVARNAERMKSAAREIAAETGNEGIDFYQADLARRAETETIVSKAVERFGRLDILVGNAGIDLLEPVTSFSDASLDQQIEVMLNSNILLTRAAIPELKKHGCGRIIFITSIAGNVGAIDGVGIYSAAKSGLHGFTRVAALELGIHGITVNCVAPGLTMTAMIEEFIASLGEAGARESESCARTTAMNRWGRPDEMIGPVLMLASDAGSFVTGTVLTVDGGTSIRMK